MLIIFFDAPVARSVFFTNFCRLVFRIQSHQLMPTSGFAPHYKNFFFFSYFSLSVGFSVQIIVCSLDWCGIYNAGTYEQKFIVWVFYCMDLCTWLCIEQ